MVDANGQSLAYVYSRETTDAAHIAKVLTEDDVISLTPSGATGSATGTFTVVIEA